MTSVFSTHMMDNTCHYSPLHGESKAIITDYKDVTLGTEN